MLSDESSLLLLMNFIFLNTFSYISSLVFLQANVRESIGSNIIMFSELNKGFLLFLVCNKFMKFFIFSKEGYSYKFSLSSSFS